MSGGTVRSRTAAGAIRFGQYRAARSGEYFHYRASALDIAAPYGSRIVAAASGSVIYAGWKDNGGGYQVWIAHGSGLYTTL